MKNSSYLFIFFFMEESIFLTPKEVVSFKTGSGCVRASLSSYMRVRLFIFVKAYSASLQK